VRKARVWRLFMVVYGTHAPQQLDYPEVKVFSYGPVQVVGASAGKFAGARSRLMHCAHLLLPQIRSWGALPG
jgi:hypothetical protein